MLYDFKFFVLKTYQLLILQTYGWNIFSLKITPYVLLAHEAALFHFHVALFYWTEESENLQKHWRTNLFFSFSILWELESFTWVEPSTWQCHLPCSPTTNAKAKRNQQGDYKAYAFVLVVFKFHISS